jgi:hypothetical protein
MEQTLAPAKVQNYNLNVMFLHVAVIKVWDAMLRGARQYVEANGFMGVHKDIRNCVPFLINRDNAI